MSEAAAPVSKPLRIIFAGTPEFARTALENLHAAGHEIVLVLTQPDRPAGRGMKLQASEVRQFAVKNSMPVLQPRSLRLNGKYPEDAKEAQQQIEQARADVMVVAAYGLILPQWVLDAMRGSTEKPALGCLNIHASLLPRWRGAAPIHRAIEAGDTETGITIMQMDAGLDTGAMLLVEKMPITADASTASLHDELAKMGGRLIVRALQQAQTGALHATAQPGEGICYAHKIEKAEAHIDWNLPASVIERKVRAFNPFPVACTSLNGEVVKVWKAREIPLNDKAVPVAAILKADHEGIDVAAQGSALRLTELQRAGGKRLAVSDFLRGFHVQP